MMGIGNLAAFVFIIAAGVSVVSLVAGVARRIGGGGPRLGRLGRQDADQQDALARLEAEVESLREEMTGMRHQLDEQAERQDFAERLLTQARERGLLQGPKEP